MKLGYIILYVPDVLKTKQFYENAFGLTTKFVDESETYAEMNTGSTVLAFASEELIDSHGFSYRRQNSGISAGAFEIALVTDDIESAHKKALDAGASEKAKPEKKPWGSMGFLCFRSSWKYS